MKSVWGRTVIGVAALDPPRVDPEKSLYTVSRNVCAGKTMASEASDRCMLPSSAGVILQATTLLLIDRNSTSSASWVMPRWFREPRIVWDCESDQSHILSEIL